MPRFLPSQHGMMRCLGDHGHPSQVGCPIRTHEEPKSTLSCSEGAGGTVAGRVGAPEHQQAHITRSQAHRRMRMAWGCRLPRARPQARIWAVQRKPTDLNVPEAVGGRRARRARSRLAREAMRVRRRSARRERSPRSGSAPAAPQRARRGRGWGGWGPPAGPGRACPLTLVGHRSRSAGSPK
jgi:hypothetical protein